MNAHKTVTMKLHPGPKDIEYFGLYLDRWLRAIFIMFNSFFKNTLWTIFSLSLISPLPTKHSSKLSKLSWIFNKQKTEIIPCPKNVLLGLVS